MQGMIFHTNMKQRITITVDKEDLEWLKSECLNISMLVNALIKRHIRMKSSTVHTIEKRDSPAEEQMGTILEVP